MKKAFMFFFVLLLSFSQVSHTQEVKKGSISGVIRDTGGNPVSGVTVKIAGQEFVTQDDGIYFIKDVPQGEHEALLSKDDLAVKLKARVEASQHKVFSYNGFGRRAEARVKYFDLQNRSLSQVTRIGVNTYASCSPDGRYLAVEVFTGKTNGFDIWIVSLEGKEAKTFSSMPEDENNPRWSPDGKKILFHTFSKSKEYKVLVKALTDMKTEFIDSGLTPAWSPDGKAIVYAKRVADSLDIYKTDLASPLASVRLTVETENRYPFWGKIGNEEKIVFASTKSGIYEIWSMNPDGSDKRQLTNIGSKTGNPLAGPVISPDGKKIVFWEIDEKEDNSVWIMDSDGSNPMELIRGAANPEWSPDGKSIFFNSRITGKSQIWRDDIY